MVDGRGMDEEGPIRSDDGVRREEAEDRQRLATQLEQMTKRAEASEGRLSEMGKTVSQVVGGDQSESPSAGQVQQGQQRRYSRHHTPQFTACRR